MLCIFIEIQACENKCISACLKILNMIRRKETLKKYKCELSSCKNKVTKKKVSKKSIFKIKI